MPRLAALTEHAAGIALGGYGNIFQSTTSQWLQTATCVFCLSRLCNILEFLDILDVLNVSDETEAVSSSRILRPRRHGPRVYPWAGRCACPMPMVDSEYETLEVELAITGESSMGVEAYAAHALRWRASGASLIGGCCGTTPGHTAALAKSLAAHATEAGL